MPQVAYALLGIPFSVKSPLGRDRVILRGTFRALHVVGEPTSVSSFPHTSVVIDPVAPRAGIYGLPGRECRLGPIGMVDVSVDDIL